jgi:hypothetical protein
MLITYGSHLLYITLQINRCVCKYSFRNDILCAKIANIQVHRKRVAYTSKVRAFAAFMLHDLAYEVTYQVLAVFLEQGFFNIFRATKPFDGLGKTTDFFSQKN